MAHELLRLSPDERVLRNDCPSAFWTGPLYLATLGLWAVWRSHYRFVLTNQRVVALRGVISKSERSVPLSRIQDVTLRRSVVSGGSIRLSSAGGGLGIEVIGPLTRDVARQFADDLSAHIRSPHSDGVSSPAVVRIGGSVSEELERLAKLRNDGVLTDEEFAIQKARLLQ